jgi:hypothetical protein
MFGMRCDDRNTEDGNKTFTKMHALLERAFINLPLLQSPPRI